MTKYTISLIQGRQVAHGHNVRDAKAIKHQDHILRGGVYEIWKDEPIGEAYERIFAEAVSQYNSSVTRESLKIDNYLTKVKQMKQVNPVYEVIITIGNCNNRPSDELCKQIMKEYVSGWQGRNSNLVLIGAYYHADERDPKTGLYGAPHVHIDYIPVGKGYDKGLTVRASRHRALDNWAEESGGKYKPTIKCWQAREREVLKEICRINGIIVTEKKQERRYHLDTEIFRKTKEIERICNEIEKMQEQWNQLRVDIDASKAEIVMQNRWLNQCDDTVVASVLGKVYRENGMAIMDENNFKLLRRLAENYTKVRDENKKKDEAISKMEVELSLLRQYQAYVDKEYPDIDKEITEYFMCQDAFESALLEDGEDIIR